MVTMKVKVKNKEEIVRMMNINKDINEIIKEFVEKGYEVHVTFKDEEIEGVKIRYGFIFIHLHGALYKTYYFIDTGQKTIITEFHDEP